MQIRLDKQVIDQYRDNDGNLSEGDKFKRSEQVGDPIRIEKRQIRDQLLPEEPQTIEDFLQRNRETDQLMDLNALVDYPS